MVTLIFQSLLYDVEHPMKSNDVKFKIQMKNNELYRRNSIRQVYNSDFAKGTGNVYAKLGFKKLELTIPNYVWYNHKTKDILTRYQTQIKNEVEIMELNGYDRIFDCGSYKWLWINNI